MHGLQRIHLQPRSGALYEATASTFWCLPLMRMRKCTDSLQMLVLLDSLPDIILLRCASGFAENLHSGDCCQNNHQVLRPPFPGPHAWRDESPQPTRPLCEREVMLGL